MWFRLKKPKVYPRKHSLVTKHYRAHKEQARALVQARLQYFNQHYGYLYGRVSIKNQRRCWGSCSSLKNLNFSYKLLFLPAHLCDYIIVHELCHLKEMNHGPKFWQLVAEEMPNYKQYVRELKTIESGGTSIQHLIKVQTRYLHDISKVIG